MSAVEDSTGSDCLASQKNSDRFGGRDDPNYNLHFGLRVRYIGTVTGTSGTLEIDAVTLYDSRIGYALGKWDFNLNGKNLTDKTHIS
jgi:iron complex outermembrane receptor protein